MCILGALALAAGCSARQAAHFPDQHVAIEDPEKARIYVIRQPTFWRLNPVVLTKTIRVRDGFLEIGSIAGQRGFVSWEREPGKMSIFANEGYLALTVTKGRTYYILARDEDPLIVRLVLVEEAKGREELAKATPPALIEGPRIKVSGVSGPVEWRAADIQPGFKYSFVLVLKETQGTSIMFTTIEQRVQASLNARGLIMPDGKADLTSSRNGTWQLPAGGELRVPFGFMLVCRECQSWTPAWSIVLTGKNEAGEAVRVDADVILPPLSN